MVIGFTCGSFNARAWTRRPTPDQQAAAPAHHDAHVAVHHEDEAAHHLAFDDVVPVAQENRGHAVRGVECRLSGDGLITHFKAGLWLLKAIRPAHG